MFQLKFRFVLWLLATWIVTEYGILADSVVQNTKESSSTQTVAEILETRTSLGDADLGFNWVTLTSALDGLFRHETIRSVVVLDFEPSVSGMSSEVKTNTTIVYLACRDLARKYIVSWATHLGEGRAIFYDPATKRLAKTGSTNWTEYVQSAYLEQTGPVIEELTVRLNTPVQYSTSIPSSIPLSELLTYVTTVCRVSLAFDKGVMTSDLRNRTVRFEKREGRVSDIFLNMKQLGLQYRLQGGLVFLYRDSSMTKETSPTTNTIAPGLSKPPTKDL